MNQAKYIGMDVHQATISVAVMDSAGEYASRFKRSQSQTEMHR